MEPKANGGATLTWLAQEFEADANGVCRPAGEEFSGTAEVAGACCETVTDVAFRRGGFTFRMVGRTDWER